MFWDDDGVPIVDTRAGKDTAAGNEPEIYVCGPQDFRSEVKLVLQEEFGLGVTAMCASDTYKR